MSQIQKKFIADNAIDGSKLKFLNNQTFRSRNASDTLDIDLFRFNTSNLFTFLVQPTADASLPLPSNPKDYATVEWVQSFILGKIDSKDAVNALAATNIALTGSAPLTIDSVNLGSATITPIKRVVLTGQSNPVENGIYDYAASVGTYTLTRSADFVDGRVTSGSWTRVIAGTLYGGYEVVLTNNDPVVVDTDALTFVKYPSVDTLSAGDMLVRAGNVFSIDLATNSGLESTNPGNAAGQLRVKTNTLAAEKDQTIKIDATGNVVAKKPYKELITLDVTDISNGYIDLAYVATSDSVVLSVAGAGAQLETVDFTVNYTGGSGSKTRITFIGGLAASGVSELESGDIIEAHYEAFI